MKTCEFLRGCVNTCVLQNLGLGSTCFVCWARFIDEKPCGTVVKNLAENLAEKQAPHPIPSGSDRKCHVHMVLSSAADSIGSFKRNPVFFQAGDGWGNSCSYNKELPPPPPKKKVLVISLAPIKPQHTHVIEPYINPETERPSLNTFLES